MTTLAVIPARAGSIRLHEKNLQEIDGATLIAHAVAAATYAEGVGAVVVSTDIPPSYLPKGINYHRRPDDLCGGAIDLSIVTKDALLAMEAQHGQRWDSVAVLQPATPLRSSALIAEMLDTMRRARCAAAITMAICVPWTWRIESGAASNTWSPSPYPRSQDVRYHNLQEINTVQIATRDVVLSGKRWDLPLLITELPRWATLDIDTQEDLDECRLLWPTLKPAFDKLTCFPFHIAHSVNGDQDMSPPFWTAVPRSLPGGAA